MGFILKYYFPFELKIQALLAPPLVTNFQWIPDIVGIMRYFKGKYLRNNGIDFLYKLLPDRSGSK